MPSETACCSSLKEQIIARKAALTKASSSKTIPQMQLYIDALKILKSDIQECKKQYPKSKLIEQCEKAGKAYLSFDFNPLADKYRPNEKECFKLYCENLKKQL